MASRTAFFPPPALSGVATAAEGWRDAGLMLLLAFAARMWWFGDPVIQVDEQLYLLMGDRLLHGAIPYIDIWDRKPIGLFLSYAGIRLLGGTGIVQYQVVATICAALTAFFVVRLARTIASPLSARMAGAASLLFTLVFDGAGGQAPVLFNPFVAGAMLIVLRAVALPAGRHGGFVAHGAAAMALIGIAIQIKYTVLFEGIAMGLVLLWAARRRDMGSAWLAAGALWIATAILPTAIAWATYAAMGYGSEFFYVNFVSIGDRPLTGLLKLAGRLGAILGLGLPLIIAAIVGVRVRQQDEQAKQARLVLLAWLVGATVGLVAIGSLYKHYALPWVTPLAVFAAAGFDAGRRERWPAVMVLVLGLILAAGTAAQRFRLRGGPEHVDRLVAMIRPNLTDRLFVFDGEPILYLLTDAPMATPFAFPGHMNQKKEAPAIPVNQAAEVRRVMATRPSVVVVTNKMGPDRNPVTWGIMRRAIARDYRLVGGVEVNKRMRLVYALDV